jgi:hypothetical protein
MPENVRKRPDPRPMRLAYAAGAVAAVSAVVAGITHVGNASTQPPTTADVVQQNQPKQAGSIEIQHVIRYIHLKPGEQAPPGATVITPDAPAPRVVVTHIAAPAAPPVVRRVIVTRQSGKP